MNLQQRIENHLTQIKNRGLWRTLKAPSENAVDLSSNDFLGLANDERIKSAMIREIRANGAGATGSRLLRGERQIFSEVERKFAEFKGTERALFFGSGYAANIGVLATFLEAGDVVFSDELNHASLIDGVRLSKAARVIFPHNDAAALERLIQETRCAGQRFLIVESLFSMDGDFAPLTEYARICKKYQIALIVDEAHAVGVFGASGSGLIEAAGIAVDVFLSINTAGKAFGVGGAFVAGDDWAIEFLIQRARSFVFSTAPPPAMAAGLLAALDIVQREPARRAKLLSLSSFLREKLTENDISISSQNSHIIPIVLGASGRAVRIAYSLQKNGFDVRAIRPPTVQENTARLRISLNTNLDEKILLTFLDNLIGVLRQTRHDFC